MKKYLLLNAFFQGGRNFFGAISVPYLLSKGIPLADLALLKSVQTISVFMLEFPTGVIADRYSRRLSLILSVIAGIATFLLYFFASSLAGFIFAEILLATTLSFWSGAFDAFAIDSLEIGKDKTKLSRFYHSDRIYVSGGIILSIIIGSVVAQKSLGLTYLLSTCTFFLILVGIFVFFKNDVSENHIHQDPKIILFLKSAKSAFKILENKKIALLSMGFITAEVILMPLIFFWQAWFTNFTENINGLGLGAVLIIFQFTIMGTGAVFAKLSKKEFSHSPFFWILMWTLFSATMISLRFANGYVSSLVIFCLLEACFIAGEGAMKSAINLQIPSSERASFLSFISLIRKAGGLLSLFFIGHLIAAGSGNLASLRNVFVVFGSFGLVLYAGLALKYFVENSAKI